MRKEDYEIIRSKRKTIALVIDSNAQLVVRCPLYTPAADIEKLVKNKQQWIAQKKHQVSVYGEKYTTVKIAEGEALLFMGDTYTIMLEPVSTISIKNGFIIVPQTADKGYVIQWLKDQAKCVLTERVKRYANMMGVSYTSLSITDAKARWGSCSLKNSLNFAWRLAMCPIYVIDYVVVHELSHIVYKNHSPLFWARVKTILPAYDEAQDWLKINRKIMEII